MTPTIEIRSHGLHDGRILYKEHVEWTPGEVTKDPFGTPPLHMEARHRQGSHKSPHCRSPKQKRHLP